MRFDHWHAGVLGRPMAMPEMCRRRLRGSFNWRFIHVLVSGIAGAGWVFTWRPSENIWCNSHTKTLCPRPLVLVLSSYSTIRRHRTEWLEVYESINTPGNGRAMWWLHVDACSGGWPFPAKPERMWKPSDYPWISQPSLLPSPFSGRGTCKEKSGTTTIWRWD